MEPLSWPVKIYSSSGPHTAAVTLDSSDNILRYGSPKETKIIICNYLTTKKNCDANRANFSKFKKKYHSSLIPI